jgi:hypothetical protein
MRVFFVWLLVLCVDLVWSHSWIHCADYDPAASLLVGKVDNPSCRAWARGIPTNAVFGEDRGFNYQPTNNRACRDSFASTTNRFVPGQKIRLVWPAKNHVAASCTNGFISYGSLRLYAYPVSDPTTADPTWSEWRTDTYLIHDFDAPGNKGFQNCPDFCPTTDRVPCFGDVVLPRNWTQGWVKFLWAWNFNPNEWFTTCFDAEIASSPTSRAPTSRSPTSRSPTSRAPTSRSPTSRAPTSRAPTSRAPTSRAPTSRAPTSRAPTLRPNCAQEWGQCGGQNWKGPRCCVAGTQCKTQSVYYAQCLR